MIVEFADGDSQQIDAKLNNEMANAAYLSKTALMAL